MIGVGYEG